MNVTPRTVRALVSTSLCWPAILSSWMLSLLSALKPASGEDFGANVGAAVHWAQQTYDMRPDRLRPPPLESWLLFTGSRRDINLNTAEHRGRSDSVTRARLLLELPRPVRAKGATLEHQPLRPDARQGSGLERLKSPQPSAQARRRLGGTSEPLLSCLSLRVGHPPWRPEAARPPRDDCRGWPGSVLILSVPL